MVYRRFSVQEVIQAIEGSGGIKLDIARRLTCDRKTVDKYLQTFPSVKEAYDQEVESVGDDAESVIIDSIRQDKTLETAKWYARVKLANRGYAERKELTGADGAPLVPIVEMVVKEPDGSDGASET